MKRFTPPLVLVLTVILLVSVRGLHAVPTLYLESRDPYGLEIAQRSAVTGPISISRFNTGELLWTNVPYSEGGGGTADYGILQAHSEAHCDPGSTQPQDHADGKAFVRFTDDLTITAPGASVVGYCTIALRLDGTLKTELRQPGTPPFANQSASFLDFSVYRDELEVSGSVQYLRDDGTMGGQNLLGRETLVTVPILLNRPFELGIALSAQTKAFAYFGADCESAGTLTWGGITAVLDVNRQPVTNYTVSSASGTDWAHPVPEPCSGALLAVGVFCAGLRRRS